MIENDVEMGCRMKSLIARLSPLRMAPNSSGLDECVQLLCEELPFQVHEFAGGSEVNGWIVPRKWEVIEAKIYNTKGKVIYDGMHHPLGVIGYSQSFSGRVSVAELKKHLYYPARFDDALVYHCDLFYKPFRKDWGFSVTKNLYDSLKEDEYDISLKTVFQDGTMKVAEFVVPGDSSESIVINAHNCHAFCCNDDLSGVAVGIEVMRHLRDLPTRRYTYRLIIAPEHFGSIFYLNSLTDQHASLIKYGVFLEMLGCGGALNLQRSFTGKTFIDRAFLNALQHSVDEFRTAPFRKVVGNDETCWEAAGYEIPFPSLSRSDGNGHFPEYHTSRDCPDLIEEDLLEEAVKVVVDAFSILERDSIMERRFRGLVALSHPRYDLYKPFWDPSDPSRKEISDRAKRWNYLMDCLPRYFDNYTRLIEIAERHNLPFRALYEYVRQFEEKGLVRIFPAGLKDPPSRSLFPH
jgi:aminopeptidase-like protein